MAKIINLQAERRNREKTNLVNCVLCNIVIKGLTEEGIENYNPQIEGAGPVHFSCYQDNLVDTTEFAKVLNRNRYGK
ncbi:MAG TPA: hypothetical protein ENI61_05760 [Ignavibacteria bacterium]|nr:hypothetical protein [Ignavibacteria bacterium]